MMVSTLSHAAHFMHGSLQGADMPFRGVSTDTRSLRAGELFIALHGPNFDGTEFLQQAVNNQAAGAVVERQLSADLPTIVVDDSLHALGQLAASWRAAMPATVIGITGSNGKTTLKELLASCLSLDGDTLATQGNLNNEIGVPLMLLRMSEQHRYAVIEMGANHTGEIAYLSSLAAAQVVVITNAAPAHLEGFGSVEGVARAKGEILAADPFPELAILNADDDYFGFWKSLARGAQMLSFGLSADADVRVSHWRATAGGSAFTLHMPDAQIAVRLHLEGKHNALNACAAAAIASSLGIGTEQIRHGLEAVTPVAGRLQPVRSVSGATVFDDSYNANPVSVQAAAEFLAAQEGTTWLVLGDMAELGSDAELLHAHTGWVIREAGVDRLLATGSLTRKTVESFGDGGRWFESIEALGDALRATLSRDDVVLVKGSRSMGMERLVDTLAVRGHTADKARIA